MGRIGRVNQMIHREVSLIVQRELEDPRLSLVTISRVEVSKDLRHAKVFFTVLGDERQIAFAQQGLKGASGFIRHLISQRVRLKFVPEFNFFYDKSQDYSRQIEEEVERLNNEAE